MIEKPPAVEVGHNYDGQLEQCSAPIQYGQADDKEVCRAPKFFVLVERVQQSRVVIQAHEEEDKTVDDEQVEFVAVIGYDWLSEISFRKHFAV